MNPKYFRIGASSFPLSAEKSRKRWRSIVLFFHYYLFKKIDLSATKENSKKIRREVDHVEESEIVPNRYVLVFIASREIEEKVPLKPLILRPPAKIVDNCLALGFHRQFFLRMRPWHHQQTEKKTASRNMMSIKFYIPQWTVNNVRTNNMVTQCQKKRAACFYWNNWPLNCLF